MRALYLKGQAMSKDETTADLVDVRRRPGVPRLRSDAKSTWMAWKLRDATDVMPACPMDRATPLQR